MTNWKLARKARQQELDKKKESERKTRREPNDTAKEIARRLKPQPDHLADGMKKHNETMKKKWAEEKSKSKKKKGLFDRMFGSKD